ncbi:MAG TPA: ribonuclease Y [Dehalococcoidia bacterium]|nr:ribonuclease Y [Dehalococcoidia bacterium]
MIIGIIVGLAALVIGAAAGYAVRRSTVHEQERAARAEADRIVREAEQREKEILLEAKEEAIRARGAAETELKDRREELNRLEHRLLQKEENLERKTESLERRNAALSQREAELDQRSRDINELRAQKIAEIERIAELTREEARNALLQEIDVEVRDDANRRVRAADAATREEAERRARDILSTVMQRVTSEVTAETTVSVVPIPSEEMKGRIIGREGRNIRALEAATGVDLIIDDTPDAVTLSGFDPIRREVARIALSKLVTDGRIHPTRIEEVVNKARQEVEAGIREAGEQAALEAEVPGLHPEILRYFGRLRYRTSYGQNQLKHAVESAHIAALIAAELGADVNVARRGALLHDLGKSIDHEVEGTHAALGAELARRHGIHEAVAHCIEAHHEEVEPRTVEAHIVMIADAISGSRPGARRESLERYIQRLEALENVANGFEGVDKSFAIQAGREVRILVKPDEIDDLGSMRLARDISKKIEETLEYPGQIKVTVVRETRASEYAK